MGGQYHPYYKSTADQFDIDSLKWRPSIHMPRWASRITLEVLSVRVERVQDISEEEAKAEGCVNDVKLLYGQMAGPIDYIGLYATERFETLWDSINAKRGYSWDLNPWVWCVDFKRVGNADQA